MGKRQKPDARTGVFNLRITRDEVNEYKAAVDVLEGLTASGDLRLHMTTTVRRAKRLEPKKYKHRLHLLREADHKCRTGLVAGSDESMRRPGGPKKPDDGRAFSAVAARMAIDKANEYMTAVHVLFGTDMSADIQRHAAEVIRQAKKLEPESFAEHLKLISRDRIKRRPGAGSKK